MSQCFLRVKSRSRRLFLFSNINKFMIQIAEGNLFFYSYAMVVGSPLLIALVVKEAAFKLERVPLQMWSHVGIYEPKGINVPEPIQVFCTRWDNDPFFFGFYSKREAALLLGQFATTDLDYKHHCSRSWTQNGSLQYNATLALYGLADNEDNVSDFIRVDGVHKLQDGEFIVQATKDCVAKTLKRLEEKIHGRVLNHLLYLMRIPEKGVQRRVALALAHLCFADDQRKFLLITMVLICSFGFLAHLALSSNLMVLWLYENWPMKL
ncbi:hypothetical protein VNO77_02881 [Canavalia gladiata]|uniref:Uncharacterized protein n=1 Tax=Canavalia gladiata TaxID=3824 RepID=A0AAN9MZD4_CANGL